MRGVDSPFWTRAGLEGRRDEAHATAGRFGPAVASGLDFSQGNGGRDGSDADQLGFQLGVGFNLGTKLVVAAGMLKTLD